MIQYKLDFSQFSLHLIQVTLTFTAKVDSPTLWLPSWIPGSYLMREFARNITRVDATIKNADTDCVKISKNVWQLPNVTTEQKVTVNYEVYAYDFTVRGAYIDKDRIYGNFTSIALAVTGQEDEEIFVNFAIPELFKKQQKTIQVACTLPMEQKSNQFEFCASDYYTLIDHPFEIADQDRFSFKVTNTKTNITIPHQFAISGKHHANLERLEADLTKICQAYVMWLGNAPFDKYLFMTMATGNDYGGLEHSNCTSLMTPRKDLPTYDEKDEPSQNYRNFLGLCSHEYFHAWWVKLIRPAVYLKPNLTEEVYTELLWVFEGFTSYFDDLMLLHSGVISESSYLEILTTQINRYYQTHGREHQSVAESSFDAWIKLYRSDENTPNAGISYYNKGALIALCLDLMLKQHGKRLSDVVKECYKRALEGSRGITDAVLDEILGSYLGDQAWQDFRAAYIDGRTELPITDLLTDNGITSKECEKKWAFGLQMNTTANGVEVTRALRAGAGANAGISAKDVIVAIDYVKATEAEMTRASCRPNQTSIHFFRRDELHMVTLASEQYDIPCFELQVHDQDKAKQWFMLEHV